MSQEVKPAPCRISQSLEWAIAEVEGQTRYDSDEQFAHALGTAKETLASISLVQRGPVSDEELQQWATYRADDAGRLARELIGYRRAEGAA